MERLRQKDLLALLDVLPDIYAPGDLDLFPQRALAALQKLVPTDTITYNEVNPRRHRIKWLMEPAEADWQGSEAIFEQHLGDHPVIRYYEQEGARPTLKISDFLSQRQFWRLGLYQEFYRRFPVEYQVAIGLPAAAPLVLGIALSRAHPDFSERERLLLDLVRPHLAQAYRNAEALSAMQEAVDLSEMAIVVLDDQGRVRSAADRAEHWLDDYFDGPAAPGGLPEPLASWLEEQRGRLFSAGLKVPPPLQPLVADRGERRLIVRFLTRGADGSHHLLLQEQQVGISTEVLIRSGLTRREAEVLRWVSRGSSDAEIANLLVLSPRTVAKYLERVYRKLGVESRTAAIAWAYEATRRPL